MSHPHHKMAYERAHNARWQRRFLTGPAVPHVDNRRVVEARSPTVYPYPVTNGLASSQYRTSLKRVGPPADTAYTAPRKQPRMDRTRTFSTPAPTSAHATRTSQSRAHSTSSKAEIMSPTSISSAVKKARTDYAESERVGSVNDQVKNRSNRHKLAMGATYSSESSLAAHGNIPQKGAKDTGIAKTSRDYDKKDSGAIKKSSETEKKAVDVTVASSSTPREEVKKEPSISELASRKMWKYYLQNKQTKVEDAIKEDMRMRLQSYIQEILPDSVLILGGSSLNGFGSKGCDADMCLCLRDSHVSQQESRQILVWLRQFLQNRCSIINNLKVIFARVPILKFNHRASGIECDLNINHITGVRNTVLLQVYSKLDWRVAPLITIIKQWSKNSGINNAREGMLSSYSFVLLILNYLQVCCKPPVLVAVQENSWGKTVFSDRATVYDYWNRMYDPHIPQHVANQSQNCEDLFSLLKGFFAYYADFDFQETVISVRLGSCFPRTLLPPNHPGWKQKYIFIEEPFDRINTARSVFDWIKFKHITEAFEEAYETLCKSKDFDPYLFVEAR